MPPFITPLLTKLKISLFVPSRSYIHQTEKHLETYTTSVLCEIVDKEHPYASFKVLKIDIENAFCNLHKHAYALQQNTCTRPTRHTMDTQLRAMKAI